MPRDILDLPPPPADVRIAYGADGEQFGDLRLPVGEGPHPVVVYIHGGFWRAAYDLSHAGHICAALTAAGFATWNIEYRRIGQDGGGWPGTLLDVAAAASHLTALAEGYPLDLGRVVVAGHSAGGQLALWLAKQHAGPLAALPQHQRRPLRGAISLAGVLDLRRAWELGLGGGVVGELLGGGPERYPERYAAASPAELVPLGVGQRIIHGVADAIVPIRISEIYIAAARAAGEDAALIPLAGGDHFDLIDPRTPSAEIVIGAARSFVD